MFRRLFVPDFSLHEKYSHSDVNCKDRGDNRQWVIGDGAWVISEKMLKK
jgi:hypothetical protein